jgi:serine/threonine protein kinase
MKKTDRQPPDDDEGDDATEGAAAEAFLREVARVDDAPPPSLGPSSLRSSLESSLQSSRRSSPVSVGQQVGRFRILGELGRGGMGIVYLAQDDQLQRPIALKVLVTGLTRHEERRRRFLREARAAASVSHPNLATIYDVGEADGRVFIAMERIEGQTLRLILATRRLSVDDAVGFMAQVLAGLAKAHQAGVVHRDLKPDNVMVTEDRVVKVLDFGLAKQHRQVTGQAPGAPGDSTLRHDTAEHQLLGTPSYMSPEQARGKLVDARSDIFAVGVILYEMLSGQRPFVAENEADLLTAILRDTPEPLARVAAHVPEPVQRVVERCLEKDPDRRYQDCVAVAADLAASLTVPGRSGMSLSSPLRGVEAPAARSPGRSRRSGPARRLGVVAASLASLAALAVVATFVIRSRPRTAPRPIAVTDLPLPASRSAEALAEYAAAMQGFRDGNWGYVYEHLDRAAALDPSLAAAHLRLAIVRRMKYPGEARVAFARALLGRASLSERDQVLLAAYEPVLNRDPPNQAEWQARLRAATVRFPTDAELFGLLSYALFQDPEEALRAARRSVELDPQYADGWQAVGESLVDLGKTDEALLALDRCITLSPATADCRGERGGVRSVQGRCLEMEDDFRHAVASSKSGVWHDGRAAALFALGRPPEAVLEVFRNKWAQLLPSDGKAVTELRDRTSLDTALGRFRDAETHITEVNRLISSDSDLMLHAEQASRLVDIYSETNRPREAASVADDYLKRNEVWIGSGEFDGVPMTMLWAMLRGGRISKDAFASRRDEWIAHNQPARGSMKGLAPLASYARGLQTPDEAREALRLFPQVNAPTVTPVEDPSMATAFGRFFVLAGRPRDALPYLRRVVNGCGALRSPVEHVRSAWLLGQALEATGDPGGACSAYSQVLRRWGDASPPSLTASKARERTRALRCPAPPGAPGGD